MKACISYIYSFFRDGHNLSVVDTPTQYLFPPSILLSTSDQNLLDATKEQRTHTIRRTHTRSPPPPPPTLDPLRRTAPQSSSIFFLFCVAAPIKSSLVRVNQQNRTAKPTMVFPNILRHVQNALVLSSALLVILVLQRLVHYEHHEFVDVMGEQPQHGDAMDASMHGGREFHIGLFRFFLPPTEEPIAAEDSIIKQQHWEVVEQTTSIHYVVDLTSNVCESLDAATVLYHSMQKKHVLHAIVDNDDSSSSSSSLCNARLTSVGYQVVPSNSISLGDRSGCTELWQAYALQNLTHVDVVVRVPVTTIIDSSNNGREHNDKNPSIRKKRRALSSSVYSSLQSIQLLRPKSAATHDSNDCRSTTPTVCQTSPCQITKQESLVVPTRKCALPWTTCQQNDTNVTTRKRTSSCRSYHDLWRQQRNEYLQETTEDIDFCQNGTYQSMHQDRRVQ